MRAASPSPTIHDVIGVRLPRQTWLSPNGEWLAHSESWADWEENTFRQRVIVTDLVRKKEVFAVDEEAFASQVEWTWDSKAIGYIAIGEGKSVLRRVDCADGSAVDVACSTSRFTDFDWHPGCSKVVIVEDAQLPAEVGNELFSVDDQPLAGSSLLIVDADTGETRRLGDWDETYAISDVSWSPSGERILFTALPEPDNRTQRQHLLVLDLRTGEPARLIGGRRAIFFPVWSGDGTRIAFLERKQRWDAQGGAALKTMRLSDASESVLLPNTEIHCRMRGWINDHIVISGQVVDRSTDIYSVSADSGKSARTTSGDSLVRTGASASRAGHGIAYIAYDEDRFPDVVVEPDGAASPVRLTDYHCGVRGWPALSQRNVVWQTTDGRNVAGVLIDARGNATTDRHPLIVLIHGGPSSANVVYTTFFHRYFEHNPYPIRQWNEQGFSVFLPDYRGSSGYGPDFREAIVGRLGELECGDIVSGLDHVLDEHGFDPERIGVAGLSYGGYLTMLLAAKYPSRFAAASAFEGFVDVRLQLYCSDGNMESYGGDVWDPNTPLGSWSPLSYVSSECPPVLLQTGDVDRRASLINSLAFYRLLKKCGGTTKLVTYKDCGHVINHPRQLAAAQEHNLEWFKRWL